MTNGDGVSGNPTLSLPQSIATSSNPQFATIEVGAASDTTLSRSAAGVLAVEGVNLVRSTEVRERLTAARTYYVRTDGSNSNTGLANTAGGAFLTLQKAWDVMVTLDLGGQVCTLKLGNTASTFTGLFTTTSPVGGTVIIEGDTSTPSNTTITDTFGIYIEAPCYVTVKHLKLVCSYGIWAKGSGTKIIMGLGIIFGASVAMITASVSGYVYMVAFEIAGNTTYGLYATLGGVIESTTMTVTLTGTPVFTVFALCEASASMSIFGATWTGAATATRYSVTLNGVINTFAGNVFPGATAGSTATGGQYA